MLNKLKKIKKRYWFLIGIIILGIILVGVRKNNSDSYSNYTVVRRTVSDKLLLAGTIDAKERADLGFASSGRVLKNNFEVGDTVKKGDVIAEISQNRLYSNLTEAKANYILTQVDTDNELESVQEDYKTKLIEQNAIVSGYKRQYISGDPQAYEIEDNISDVTPPVISGSYSGDVEGEYIIDVYKSSSVSGYSFRVSGLESGTYQAETYQPGKLGELGLYIQFTEGDSYSDTEWLVSLPNIRSSTYIDRKIAYVNSIKTKDRIIADAKNNLDRVKAFETTDNVSRVQAQKKQAGAQVDAVYAQIGDGKIIAPFDGIIVKNDLEVGEIVNAFITEIILFSGEEKELNINTPEIYINKINIGDLVHIELDAYADINFTGVVDFIDFIDTEVDGVPVYKTDIIINANDPRIRSGMNAKASITSKSKENVIAIPAHYINIDDNGKKQVFVSTGGHFEEAVSREIVTGFHGNEGLVEIISGLEEGEVIILINN